MRIVASLKGATGEVTEMRETARSVACAVPIAAVTSSSVASARSCFNSAEPRARTSGGLGVPLDRQAAVWATVDFLTGVAGLARMTEASLKFDGVHLDVRQVVTT